MVSWESRPVRICLCPWRNYHALRIAVGTGRGTAATSVYQHAGFMQPFVGIATLYAGYWAALLYDRRKNGMVDPQCYLPID